jgi:hypothetical protein
MGKWLINANDNDLINKSKQVLPALLYSVHTQIPPSYSAEVMKKSSHLSLDFQSRGDDLKFGTAIITIHTNYAT